MRPSTQGRAHASAEPGAALDRVDGRGATGTGLGLLFLLAAGLVLTLVASPGSEDVVLVASITLGAAIVAIAWNIGAGEGPRPSALAAIAATAFATATVTVARDDALATILASIVLLAVGFGTPAAIVSGLRRRRVLDVGVLFGATSVYLLVGMAFAMLYSILAIARDTAAFLGPDGATDGDLHDRVYFSYVTLSTTGYGDFVARDPFVRAVAVLEALGGQLYLVIAMTSVVSVLLSRRAAAPSAEAVTARAADDASPRTPPA